MIETQQNEYLVIGKVISGDGEIRINNEGFYREGY